MLEITIENKYGEQLDFTNNPDYTAIIESGLTPPAATINTSTIATMDGSVFNSSFMNNRNIVMTITPTSSIESNRINLYKYLKSKQYVKLYLKNGLRDVWIEGYVESIEGNLYEAPQKLQVSIICPDPYFKSLMGISTNFSNTVDAFKFPFAIEEAGVPISTFELFLEKNINNPSDDETGIVIELYARDKVLEPTIYNQTTNEHFTVEYEMQEGDKIIINTRKGEKSIVAIRGGVETNIINKIERGSKWFNLVAGDNLFAYECVYGTANLQITFVLQPIYEGV